MKKLFTINFYLDLVLSMAPTLFFGERFFINFILFLIGTLIFLPGFFVINQSYLLTSVNLEKLKFLLYFGFLSSFFIGAAENTGGNEVFNRLSVIVRKDCLSEGYPGHHCTVSVQCGKARLNACTQIEECKHTCPSTLYGHFSSSSNTPAKTLSEGNTYITMPKMIMSTPTSASAPVSVQITRPASPVPHVEPAGTGLMNSIQSNNVVPKTQLLVLWGKCKDVTEKMATLNSEDYIPVVRENQEIIENQAKNIVSPNEHV